MAFDQYGRVIRSAASPRIQATQNTYVAPTPRTTTTYTRQVTTGYVPADYTSMYRGSLWTRIDNAVRRFGNNFAEYMDDISEILLFVITIAFIVGLGFYIFKDSNLLYIIGRGFLAVIIFGLGGLVLKFVGNYLLPLILLILRYCMWNLWTLIITLVLAAGVGVYYYAFDKAAQPTPGYEQTAEPVVAATTTYEVTSYELNVRDEPNKKARIEGKLHKGDRVEVYEITDGFAAIDYHGARRYISTKFIRSI